MDIGGLQAFVAIADHTSFSRAAEQLHLSQPAVSKRIALLERRLGHQLLDRVGHTVLLTDAGRTLLPYARRTLTDAADGRRALSHLDDTVSGELTLGTSHHVGLHRLPPILRRFTHDCPDVDLDLHFMDSEVACADVQAGRLELALITLPPNAEPKLVCEAIWDDPLVVMVAPNHPLASHPAPVSLHVLATHPAVLPDATTFTHRIITQAFRAHGIAPTIKLATNYLETLKMLVSIGLGWSMLPRSMLAPDVREIAVEQLTAQRSLGFVRHQDRAQSAAAQALIGLTRTLANEGAASGS